MKKEHTGGSDHLLAGVIMDGIAPKSLNKAVKSDATAFEFRIDSFKDIDAGKLVGLIADFKKRAKRPVILTIRSKREGGVRPLTDTRRLEIFTALMPVIDFVDIELSSVKILKDVVKSAKKNKKKIIVSFHDFKRTPSYAAISGIVARARRAGADIVKIACRADSADDIRVLARTLLGPGRLIVISMGPFGKIGRVFFPMLGSLISYCPVTRQSAPGQLSIAEFKDLSRRVV